MAGFQMSTEAKGLLDARKSSLVPIVHPVAKFMGGSEALARPRRVRIHGDDGSPLITDYSRFATVQRLL